MPSGARTRRSAASLRRWDLAVLVRRGGDLPQVTQRRLCQVQGVALQVGQPHDLERGLVRGRQNHAARRPAPAPSASAPRTGTSDPRVQTRDAAWRGRRRAPWRRRGAPPPPGCRRYALRCPPAPSRSTPSDKIRLGGLTEQTPIGSPKTLRCFSDMAASARVGLASEDALHRRADWKRLGRSQSPSDCLATCANRIPLHLRRRIPPPPRGCRGQSERSPLCAPSAQVRGGARGGGNLIPPYPADSVRLAAADAARLISKRSAA